MRRGSSPRGISLDPWMRQIWNSFGSRTSEETEVLVAIHFRLQLVDGDLRNSAARRLHVRGGNDAAELVVVNQLLDRGMIARSRIALGAQRADLLWLILRQAVVVTAIGLTAGIPITIAGGKAVTSLLNSVKPSDSVSLATAAVSRASWPGWKRYLPHGGPRVWDRSLRCASTTAAIAK